MTTLLLKSLKNVAQSEVYAQGVLPFCGLFCEHGDGIDPEIFCEIKKTDIVSNVCDGLEVTVQEEFQACAKIEMKLCGRQENSIEYFRLL